MSINMSYCRFQNTLQALRECDEALADIDMDLGNLSDEEQRAARSLLKLCKALGELSDEVQA